MAKKKQYDENEGVWRTIGGRRVFIRKGQSLSDAMKESGKFKKASDVKREEYQRTDAEVKHKIAFHNVLEAERKKERYDGRTQLGKEAKAEYLEARRKNKETWDYRENFYRDYNNPEEYKGGVAGVKGKHVEPNMKADLKKNSWREYFNNDEAYSEHDIQSYELNGNYLLKQPYDVGVGYNWQVRTDGENRGVSFAIERNKYNQMEKDGTLIPVKNFQEGVEKLRGLPAKNLEKGTKNISEAEKYYSKLGQYQAREDLDMRKSWLDDNVYAPDKRKEYEDFYKQGEEYYQKKYGNKAGQDTKDLLKGEKDKYISEKEPRDELKEISGGAISTLQTTTPKSKADRLKPGTEIYYKGDQANTPGYFTVESFEPEKEQYLSSVTLKEKGGEGRIKKIGSQQIEDSYTNNYASRFSFKEDYDNYRNKIFEGYRKQAEERKLKERYKDTYEYLKNTKNMSGSDILELLKKIDEDKK